MAVDISDEFDVVALFSDAEIGCSQSVHGAVLQFGDVPFDDMKVETDVPLAVFGPFSLVIMSQQVELAAIEPPLKKL